MNISNYNYKKYEMDIHTSLIEDNMKLVKAVLQFTVFTILDIDGLIYDKIKIHSECNEIYYTNSVKLYKIFNVIIPKYMRMLHQDIDVESNIYVNKIIKSTGKNRLTILQLLFELICLFYYDIERHELCDFDDKEQYVNLLQKQIAGLATKYPLMNMIMHPTEICTEITDNMFEVSIEIKENDI
jgi:hypothetical protein